MRLSFIVIRTKRLSACFVSALLMVFTSVSQAQWLTQSFNLRAGWNGVYLNVDASHETIDTLVRQPANPIVEIWRWNPRSTEQFDASSLADPFGTRTGWSSWVRVEPDSQLKRLVGNSAYLVKVGTNVASYTWQIQGRPVTPLREWRIDGLNLLGFSTSPTTPPTFVNFLASAPKLDPANVKFYRYVGGEIASKTNPQKVPLTGLFATNVVQRGEAYWIESEDVFNRYFGPFEVRLASSGRVDFGDHLSTFSVRIRNLSADALTVTLQLVESEPPPTGQTAIVAAPPLLVRGDLNLTNLTYGYTNLPVGDSHSWTLTGRGLEGSEVEVVLGLNRSAITASAGELLAGILRLTDSLGHSQVDVPVSATVSPGGGLWVGAAAVTHVGQYLKSYTRDASDALVVTNGHYEVAGIDTNLTSVPSVFSLRLIVHCPADNPAVLLQRVYYGLDASTNPVVACQESSLNPAFLSEARRISAAHLPWTENNPGWSFTEPLAQGAFTTASVTNDFKEGASNPFLHTYHPDHDNLDSGFDSELPRGSESYTLVRDITLQVMPPGNDFSSLTSGNSLTGNYLETIRMLGLARGGGAADTREFVVRGVFSLNQVSDVTILTKP